VTGNCTVVRLDLSLSPSAPPRLASSTVIGTGYPWRADKAALILAPTGLLFGIITTQAGNLLAVNDGTNALEEFRFRG